MKFGFFMVSMFSMFAASLASASTVYQCTTTDKYLAPLTVYVQGTQNIEYATRVEGKLVPRNKLALDEQLETPDGYTGYFARGGCNQNPGVFPHCFAIWTDTLFVTTPMLSGAQYGKAILNTENYDCTLQ
jgi:hypothetical protein